MSNGESVHVCQEHSGLKTWVQVGCALLSVLIGLFSYSTFVQVPDVRNIIDRASAANEKRFFAIERDITDLRLTDSRIINQRNLDHNNKEKLQ